MERADRRPVDNNPPSFASRPCCAARDLACSFVLGLVGAAGAVAVARLANKTRKVILLSASGGFVAGALAGRVFGHSSPAKEADREAPIRSEVEEKNHIAVLLSRIQRLTLSPDTHGKVEGCDQAEASKRLHLMLGALVKLEKGEMKDTLGNLPVWFGQAWARIDEVEYLDVTGPKFGERTAIDMTGKYLQFAS